MIAGITWALALLLTPFLGAEPSPVERDLRLLQGSWVPIRAEGGTAGAVEGSRSGRLIFGVEIRNYDLEQGLFGGFFDFSSRPLRPYAVTGNRFTHPWCHRAMVIRIDPTRSPKAIDFCWADQPDAVALEGIYRLEGDELTVAFSPPFHPRPMDFPAVGIYEIGPPRTVYHFRRTPFLIGMGPGRPGPRLSGDHRTQLQGHADTVNAVAFSPDGRTLASASDDRTVKLWDVATGRNTVTLGTHGSYVLTVAFSPDGATLATGGLDKTVLLWDGASGRLRAVLQGFPGWVRAVAFSPDGRTLAAACRGHGIQLWDVAAAGPIAELAVHHPDPVPLSVGWHAGPYPAPRTWPLHLDNGPRCFEGALTIAFSPDGHTLAAGTAEGVVQCWDVATGRCLHTLRDHAGAVWSVAFRPDGRALASAGTDGTVRVWDVAAGRALATLEAPGDELRAVAFSPDTAALVAGGKCREGLEVGLQALIRWDLAQGQLPQRFVEALGGITCLAFSPDGRHLATGGPDPTILLWSGGR